MPVPTQVTNAENAVKAEVASVEAKGKALLATEEAKTVKLTSAVIAAIAAFVVGFIVAHL